MLTYAELDARANRMAQALRSRGVGRGQRVGLCIERGADMLAAVLGVLKTGAAYVPLDPSFPAERLRFMADDAQLALLVSDTDAGGLPLVCPASANCCSMPMPRPSLPHWMPRLPADARYG